MTTENLALFRGLGAKMDYLNQRQRVISQNIANTDTPGYRPQDLVDVNFGKILERISKPSKIQLETTDKKHLPPNSRVPDPREAKQDGTYEVAPSGNAVIMEEQLIEAGKTAMDYNLMARIYQKNVGMLRMAIRNQ